MPCKFVLLFIVNAMNRSILCCVLFFVGWPLFVQANPITVTDDTGQQITFAQPAQRIVALAPHIVETLFAAGAGSKIIGTVDYSDYPAAAKSIRRIGGYSSVDLETLVALKPDLVIGWETGNSPATIAKIQSLGIPVYLTQSNKVSQVATEIQKFGRLAGTEKIAQPVADRFKKRLAKLQQIYGSRPTVTVFYQISESPLMTIGGNQIISNALDICGGKNVFNALTPMASVVSVESVLAANPEAIMASGMEQTNPTTFDQWKKWSKLTATQNNNFFLVDPDLMNRNGPRILDGTQMLCEAIQIARNRRLSQAGNHQN